MSSCILRTLKNNLLLSIFTLSAVIASVVFALFPPLILERIIDGLVDKKSIQNTLPVIYFMLIAMQSMATLSKAVLICMLGQRFTHAIRLCMSDKLCLLPTDYYVSHESGAIVSLFVSDVNTLENLFTSGIVGMMADVFSLLGILTVIFIKSIGLGLIMLFVLPCVYFFTRYIQKRMLKAQIKNREAVARMNSHVPESIRNIRTIHVYGKERYMEDIYDSKIGQSYDAVDKVNFCDAVYSPVILIINALVVAALMVLAASGGSSDVLFSIGVGSSVAMISYIGSLFAPIENIGMEIQSVQSSVAGIKRINIFLSESEKRKTDISLTADKIICSGKHAIEFNNVTFGYSIGDTVIDSFSLVMMQGERVVLRGRTGAGKSTLLKLAMGLYSPLSGSVRVYGVAADLIDDSQKRRIFGYVSQRFDPVPGSVFDQIAVFDESLNKAAVQRAAELVGIHESIINLKDGYSTVYDDNLFSEGQKQLLNICRSIVCDPPILLLDEITAKLDSQTESRVENALRKVSEKRCVLSVSHRLYTNVGEKVVEI